ncbi:MAG TPA: TonB family protein [Vicinamibacteria bacterium]|nr:TonB family protein [Vicinamibacteria bacterium]
MSDEKRQAAGEVPSSIGRYRITGALGFGAMGAVYKAFDPLIKRALAIKTIRLDVPPSSPQHRAFRERFYQEARISGTLSHPNIVTLFDIGEENDVPFLAMEYVEGKTIGAILEEGTRFKPERVIALVSQIAAALDYAHSRGVVHRDIKPTNLIVNDADKVKVTDFGIAKLADADITHSGALLGTPSYMSPEQAMGEKLDGRSDIFSLGVVAFEMLSGQQPFPGANVTSILYKLVHVDPVEPADLEMSGLVPQKWREVFHKVLAKKPEGRYQTASAFVQDLEYCLGSWFAGLGTEETVSLHAPTLEETTVTIPGGRPIPAAPVPPEDQETLVLVGPPDGEPGTAVPRPLAAPGPAAGAEAATLVIGAGHGPASGGEATVRLPTARPIGEQPAPPTVLMSPPEASRTLPPEPPAHDVAMSAPAPRRSGPRPAVPVPWALAGAAAVAALAVGIVGWARWQRTQGAAEETAPPVAEASPSPSAPATEAPPTRLGVLRIESDPSGARVHVNGEAKGRTPLRLSDLPFGSYRVRLERNGYEPQTRDVSLSAAAAAGAMRFVLSRPAPPLAGGADVVSTPPGASVSVDGRPAGTTPLAGLKLKPGPHRLEVALEGHETWAGTVDVAAGETGRVEVQLQALARPATPPTPEPVDPARVYENAATDVDTLAKKLSGTSPSYPSDRAGRLKSGERVSVLVRFVVTETGEVQEVSVLESGGKSIDDVVVSAIRGWRFQPAVKRGTRVKVQVTFKQTFLGG